MGKNLTEKKIVNSHRGVETRKNKYLRKIYFDKNHLVRNWTINVGKVHRAREGKLRSTKKVFSAQLIWLEMELEKKELMHGINM